MIHRLIFLALFLLTASAIADQNSTSADASEAATVVAAEITREKKTLATNPTLGSAVVTTNPLRVVFGLLLVVGLIFAVAWLLRRLSSVSMLAGQGMKVVATLSVGPREKVLLVDVGGQQLLLGVAPGRVSHLQSFEQPVIALDSQPSGEFSIKIKQLLNKQGAGQ